MRKVESVKVLLYVCGPCMPSSLMAGYVRIFRIRKEGGAMETAGILERGREHKGQ